MFTLLIFFLPTFMCAIWALQFMLRPGKTVGENIFMVLCVCSAIYFFAEANYIYPPEDYKTFVIADALSQMARPLIPPLILMFLMWMMRGKCCNTWVLISFIVGVSLGSMSLATYFMMGLDGAADYQGLYDKVHDMPEGMHNKVYMMHQIFCVYAYRALIIGHSILGTIYVIWVLHRTRIKPKEYRDFLFRGGEMEPQHIIAALFLLVFITVLVKFLFGRYFFLEHRTFAVVFVLFRTALVYLTGFVTLYGRWATVNVRTMFTYILPSDTYASISDSAPQKYIPEPATAPQPYIQMIEDIEDPEEASIMDKINSAMFIDKLFLNPHLTLDDLASHIGTNRTYISNAISQTMNTSFYDYVNSFRIKYSQEYMLRHPKATQDVVAEESGFANASAFNRKFKQVMQTTPRLWMLQKM